MVDMGSIAAALGSLKSAGEIAKALLQLKSDVERQGKVIELQSLILAAQSSAIAAQSDQHAMIEEVRALKDEIAKIRAWDTERQRYQLVVPFTGVTVYALKRSASNGEPPHYICANCHQAGKRSVIQHTKNAAGFVLFACSVCKFSALTPYRGIGPDVYAEDVQTRG